MDFKVILMFILSAIQLILCAGLFSVARNNKRAKWLAISIIPSFFWTLFIGLFFMSHDEAGQKLFATAYYIAAALLVPCYMFMAFIFTDRKISRPVGLGIIAASIAICLMIIVPYKFIASVNVATHAVDIPFTPYIIYVVYFMTFYLISMSLVFFAYLRKRKRTLSLGLFSIGWLVLGGIGMTFNLFLPLFGSYELIWFGPLGLIILVPMAFRIATTNEHFSAVKTFTRGLLYCIFGFLFLAFSFLTLYAFDNIVIHVGSELEKYLIGITVIALIAIMLLLFYQLMKKIIKQMDSEGFNEVELISAISRITAVEHDPREFFRATRHTLDKAFDVRQVDIMVFNENTAVHIASIVEDTIVRLVSGSKRHAIYRGDVRVKKDFDTLIAHDIEVVVPIVSAITGHAIGAILLAPRRRKFDRYYGKILENVSAILAPFIQSSVYHKEILKMNDKMKEEIARKTQKLRDSNKELLKLDEMKSDLLTIASHNLRTPITGISGYAEMLLSDNADPLSATQRSYIEAIMRSSNTMRQMISSLLDVSHIDSGDFVLHNEPLDLAALVREEVAPLRKIAEKKGRSLTLTNEKHLEIIGDVARLKQVIINLVDNAIYYSKTKVDVTLKKTDSYIIFEVKDDGIGVPKDEQRKIFEKMYRASNAEIQRPDGTGVGLYVAKSIIEASGGELVFESTEGKGSTFGFKINIK